MGEKFRKVEILKQREKKRISVCGTRTWGGGDLLVISKKNPQEKTRVHVEREKMVVL